jgi:DNA-binding MarR family transcriptional regulator
MLGSGCMPVPTRSSAVPVEAARAQDSLEASLVATIPPVMRHLLAHARRRPSWAEMTYQQYNVLRIIDREGAMAQGEIARRLMVSAPVITRQAAALTDDGLVERRPDPADRRSIHLALTTRGRRRVRAMRGELLAAASELLAPLPEDQRGSLAVALEHLQVLLPARKVAQAPSASSGSPAAKSHPGSR